MKKILVLTLLSGFLGTNSFAITTLWNRTSITLAINGTRVENRGSIQIDETTNATIACYYYGESREPLFFTFNTRSFNADQHYHVYVQRSLSNRALGDQKFM